MNKLNKLLEERKQVGRTAQVYHLTSDIYSFEAIRNLVEGIIWATSGWSPYTKLGLLVKLSE